MSDAYEPEMAFIIERLRWLAYLNAWIAGYVAGGGDRDASDLPGLADADYQRVKNTWGKPPQAEETP